MAIQVITKDNFDEIIQSALPVMIDFWAPWCAPCRMLTPIIEEIAADTDNKAIVGKVNVDNDGELAARFGITGIPTVLVFKDGKLAETVVGIHSKSDLLNLLK